ncbi:MAG: cation:proton antiporter, partial [Pseudonocardiales bacterium]|nr:cation:proton antiporter [Pseudonocardiales bacterium]
GPVLATRVFKPESASTLEFTLFVGVMLAATALPVMVRILQERGLSRSPLGCTGIAASAVATVGLFIAASTASSINGAAGTAGALRALGLAVGYLGLMLLVVRPLLAKIAARPGRGHDAGVGLLVCVLVLLLASGLAAQLAGLTVIVGGFLAGLVLPAQAAVRCALEQRLGELTRSVLLPDLSRLLRPAYGSDGGAGRGIRRPRAAAGRRVGEQTGRWGGAGPAVGVVLAGEQRAGHPDELPRGDRAGDRPGRAGERSDYACTASRGRAGGIDRNRDDRSTARCLPTAVARDVTGGPATAIRA